MEKKNCNKRIKTIYYSISIIVILAILCTLFYIFWFLRDPVRIIPEGNLILSPADGRIVRLFKITDTEFLDIDKGILGGIKTTASEISDSAYVLVIMMTPFDVHYQRAPIEGTIKSVEYKEGSFLNIMDDARSLVAFNNEKNEIVISGNRDGEKFDIKIIQVAGFLVRRIVDYVDVSQIVEKGEHIGLIKFGSMVIMIFPDTFDPMVSEGDYIYGAETIIAEY